MRSWPKRVGCGCLSLLFASGVGLAVTEWVLRVNAGHFLGAPGEAFRMFEMDCGDPLQQTQASAGPVVTAIVRRVPQRGRRARIRPRPRPGPRSSTGSGTMRGAVTTLHGAAQGALHNSWSAWTTTSRGGRCLRTSLATVVRQATRKPAADVDAVAGEFVSVTDRGRGRGRIRAPVEARVGRLDPVQVNDP